MEQTLLYEPPIPQGITAKDILAALDRVPQSYREVLLLSDVGMVMSRLSRGRAILRTQLSATTTSVLADMTQQAFSSASI